MDIFSKLMLSLVGRVKLLDLDLLLPLCSLPIQMAGSIKWISNPSFARVLLDVLHSYGLSRAQEGVLFSNSCWPVLGA